MKQKPSLGKMSLRCTLGLLWERSRLISWSWRDLRRILQPTVRKCLDFTYGELSCLPSLYTVNAWATSQSSSRSLANADDCCWLGVAGQTLMFFSLCHSGPLLYGRPHIPDGLLHWWGRRTAIQAPKQHSGGLLLRTLCPVHILHHSGTAVCREGMLAWLTSSFFFVFCFLYLEKQHYNLVRLDSSWKCRVNGVELNWEAPVCVSPLVREAKMLVAAAETTIHLFCLD